MCHVYFLLILHILIYTMCVCLLFPPNPPHTNLRIASPLAMSAATGLIPRVFCSFFSRMFDVSYMTRSVFGRLYAIAAMHLAGWMDGWMDGWLRGLCLQAHVGVSM